MRRLLPTLVLMSLVAAVAAAADGPPATRPSGPHVRMRIVYVLDASDSMKEKFPVLRDELLKAIDTLKDVQEFNLVVTSDGKARPVSDALLVGTPDNKRKASELLKQVTPSGDADAPAALRAAFAAKPHVVFFITNAAFPNHDQVLKEIRTLNADKRTRVVTISGRPVPEAAATLLIQIAAENGGIYKQFPKAPAER